MSEQNENAPIEWATLDDLTPADLNVILEIDDRRVRLPLKMPSFFRIQEIFGSVINPAPPFEFKKDKDGELQKEFIFADPTYLQQVTMCNHERNYRLILDCWRQDKLAIPGSTHDEKITWLKSNLSVTVVNQLVDIITQVGGKGKAVIETRAATFHGNGLNGTAGDASAEHSDAGGVEQPAG